MQKREWKTGEIGQGDDHKGTFKSYWKANKSILVNLCLPHRRISQLGFTWILIQLTTVFAQQQ